MKWILEKTEKNAPILDQLGVKASLSGHGVTITEHTIEIDNVTEADVELGKRYIQVIYGKRVENEDKRTRNGCAAWRG